MDIRPVKKYKTPKYPDRVAAANNPELLKKLPNRWKKNVCITTALSSLLMLTLTSCKEGEVTGSNITEKEAMVAPIFDYGSGRGSFGCMSIAPPSFLSEEEAFQVIQEEGKKYGINFNKDGLELKNINIPETKYFLKPEEVKEGSSSFKEKGGIIENIKIGDLKLDGYDDEKKIAFEFVSREDYDNWHSEEGVWSSVQDFDFLSVASALRNGLENSNGHLSIGVFYNPMERLPENELKQGTESNDWDAMEARIKDMAEDNLRKQVKDFLEWLKAQGIM